MTSFQKKARIKIGNIPGTRPSLYNNQLLVSTGIPSLDNVIGGGLAVGTLLIVEEDTFGGYAKLMLKYFIAEGIVSKQGVYLCSKQESHQQILQELPDPILMIDRKSTESSATSQQPASQKPSKENSDDSGNEKMKIAWRYQNKPKVHTSTTTGIQFGHHYDLTKVMNENHFDNSKLFFFNEENNSLHNDLTPLKNKEYFCLLQDIQHTIDEFNKSQQKDEKNILRISVQSLGSPLWSENGGLRLSGEGYDQSLIQFFVSLRAKLRSTLAVGMITLPTYLFHDHAFVRRIERLADYVIRLESFAGSDKNPAFKEYHGLLHLVQVPRLNSLVPAQAETPDLAFKLKRKKFTIERFHLPPDVGEPTKKENENLGASKSPCGTTDKLAF